MPAPLISIIIPTRNRHNVLRSCLRCFAQQVTEDFEVLVFNNSDPHLRHLTQEVVDAAANPRIRIEHSPEPLPMRDSWEAAMAASRGQYLAIIGDDDTIFPYGLDLLSKLLKLHPDVPINWQPPWYYWPDARDSRRANTFRMPTVGGTAHYADSEFMVRQVCRYDLEFPNLPTIYTSCMPRTLYRGIVEKFGRMFHARSPDVGSGFLIAGLVSEYLRIPLPITIAGISGGSNGAAASSSDGTTKTAAPQVRDFHALNSTIGLTLHPGLPQLPANYAVEIASSAMTVADLLRERQMKHEFLKPDARRLLSRAAQHVNFSPPEERETQWTCLQAWAEKQGHGAQAKAAITKARARGFTSGSDDRESPAQNIGWVPHHSRFYGLADPERISDIHDFAQFASMFFRYEDIHRDGRLPECLERVRRGPNGRLAAARQWLRDKISK